MKPYAYIACCAMISSLGSLLVRHGGKDLSFSQGIWHVVTHGHLWLTGIFVGWIAGMSYALILTRMEISLAASLMIPLTYFLTFFGGVAVLGESISTNKILGCFCILAGLYFMTR